MVKNPLDTTSMFINVNEDSRFQDHRESRVCVEDVRTLAFSSERKGFSFVQNGVEQKKIRGIISPLIMRFIEFDISKMTKNGKMMS